MKSPTNSSEDPSLKRIGSYQTFKDIAGLINRINFLSDIIVDDMNPQADIAQHEEEILRNSRR